MTWKILSNVIMCIYVMNEANFVFFHCGKDIVLSYFLFSALWCMYILYIYAYIYYIYMSHRQ